MAVSDMGSLFDKLHLTETSAISLGNVEEDYILDISAQSRNGSNQTCDIAATSSNNTIRLFSGSNLATKGTIKGHKNTITGIAWSKTEPTILFSSSTDKSIRCWDTRDKLNKEVQNFSGSDETDNIFTCIDINMTDRVLCAGQEAAVKGGDVYLMFWDRRGKELMGCYSESHQDDITQVSFHPDNPDVLISGSTDGLVCSFDLSQTTEDDALTYTFNSNATVAKIGWCCDNYTSVYCTTHMDTFHVWDNIEGDLQYESTDVKDKLKDVIEIDYIVDCLSSTESDDLYMLAGKHDGSLCVLDMSSGDCPRVICSLSKGHNSTVRCLYWDQQRLLTGGEDSMLCLWSTATQSTHDNTCTDKVKLKAKTPFQRRKANFPY